MKTVLLLVGLISAAAAVSCLDEGGNPVDWWVMIKMPKLKTSKDPAAGSGFGYAYMDGSTGGWVIPGKRLDENVNGALGATIQQRSSSIAFGAYNDDPPDGHASSSYGHAKGVFGFDKSGGFWLLHSVPRFPRESSEAYTFPDYAKIYGQSFICGTFDAATFNDIGTQLQYYRGAFYESNLPADLESLAPNIYAAANGEFIKDAGSNIKTIKTKGGFAMDHMAKNAKYADDFWETMPEPHYDSSMHIETWIRSPVEPSYCKPEWAYNSQSVRFMGFPGTDIDWKYTQDHSKWGITVDGPTVTCIGGINRMLSQKKRGGGAMCINHAGVHAAFQSLIVDVDPCPALDEPKAVLALPQTTFAAPTSAPALIKLSAPVAALTKLSAPVAALNKFSAPAPALTTFAAPSKDNDACDVCEAAIDQIKEEIGKPEVRAALIGSLKEACEHLPSGSETCKTAVEEFVGKALDAAAGIDSHRVCKALQACDGSFELGDLSQAFVQLLVADAVNEEGFKAGAGPQCAACKAAVKKIKELLTSDAVVEKIVGVLDEACGKLPDEEKAEKCVAAVEKFVPKLVGLIGKIPGTLICKAAHLC